MTHPTRPDRTPSWTLLTLFIAAMLSLSAGARVADVPPPAAPQEESEPSSAEFIEYRSLPELGQITITDGVVRGAKSVARLEGRAAQLAKHGIFACTDDTLVGLTALR